MTVTFEVIVQISPNEGMAKPGFCVAESGFPAILPFTHERVTSNGDVFSESGSNSVSRLTWNQSDQIETLENSQLKANLVTYVGVTICINNLAKSCSQSMFPKAMIAIGSRFIHEKSPGNRVTRLRD